MAIIVITIVKTTAKMWQRFKKWLNNRRHFIFSLYTEDSQETQEPEQTLIELPPQVRRQLVEAVENLPSNPADKEAIVSALDETFARWREDPNNANNSIVILSSPVVAVSRILSETLEEWTQQKQLPTRLLPLTARPKAIATIKAKLEHYLKSKSSENNSDEELEIVVIPNLSWCFVRSLEGLEGIKYLQTLLCDGSRDRFWIIGGGQVSWQYLNYVFALEAYCGEVFDLPTIAPEKLEQWLDPIIDELKITFGEPDLDKQILDREKDNKTNYFDRLADLSQGVGEIAVQIFLKSIRYSEDPDEAETEGEPPPQPEAVLVAQDPELEKLPNLKPTEQYLLYSLLLHGDLTVSALAESLGDEEAQVQAMVQMLRRAGVVEQRDRVLKINPIHYPKLKRELASNNFIINRE
ncbi:MAG: helix-turn-helix domain-containing protein [Pleurocapsa sp. MO_226.B13]|nr:helix-turn-helix domain-containing protein [Pleurocapsa sp. MO_226.B13]